MKPLFFIKICLYLNNKLNEFNNQSIGHRFIRIFSIFLVTRGFLPTRREFLREILYKNIAIIAI